MYNLLSKIPIEYFLIYNIIYCSLIITISIFSTEFIKNKNIDSSSKCKPINNLELIVLRENSSYFDLIIYYFFILTKKKYIIIEEINNKFLIRKSQISNDFVLNKFERTILSNVEFPIELNNLKYQIDFTKIFKKEYLNIKKQLIQEKMLNNSSEILKYKIKNSICYLVLITPSILKMIIDYSNKGIYYTIIVELIFASFIFLITNIIDKQTLKGELVFNYYKEIIGNKNPSIFIEEYLCIFGGTCLVLIDEMIMLGRAVNSCYNYIDNEKLEFIRTKIKDY